MKINHKFFTVLFLMLFSSFSSNVFSHEEFIDKPLKGKDYVYVFPINHTKKPAISLLVVVPRNFKGWETHSERLDFVPITDVNNQMRSKMITIFFSKVPKVSAKSFLSNFLDVFPKERGFVLLEIKDTSKNLNYDVSESIIKYIDNGREEVVMTHAVSGPSGMAIIQFTIPLNNSKELNRTVKELKSFIKERVKIVDHHKVMKR
ncbi:MAG: hypothetical protein JWM09_1523 [Francisellaceae bacterium]|nr:hypothetical protein [Francisellaceae bacterium]